MFSVGNWWLIQPFGGFQSRTVSLREIFPLGGNRSVINPTSVNRSEVKTTSVTDVL